MPFKDIYTDPAKFEDYNFKFVKDPNRSVADVALQVGLKRYTELFIEANLKVCQNVSAIEQVAESFADPDSQQQFCQAMAASTLKPFQGKDPDPFEESEKMPDLFAAEAAALQQDASLPKISADPQEQSFLHVSLFNNFGAQKYRYQDVVKVDQGEILIDGGACYGATTLWAYQAGAAKVYSFEPGANNFKYLVQNLEANQCDPQLAFKLCLDDSAGTKTFYSGPQLGWLAKVAPAKKIKDLQNLESCCGKQVLSYLQEVPSVRLDAWCQEQHIEPTMIKLDITGGSLAALQGSSELIQALKPKLAICINQPISDFWEIPLYLKSLVPEYQLYGKALPKTNDFILFAKI